jgi:hypothetical protein
MSESVKENLDLNNIISCGVLLLSIALFLYLVLYRNADRNITHLESLIQKAETESGQIEKPPTQRMQEMRVNTPVKHPPQNDSPAFLETINKEFIVSGVELDHIEKLDKANYTYRFVAYAPFNRLLNFLSRIEQSNLAIQDLDVHPYARDKNLINMTLRLIKNEMYPDEKRAFEAQQEKLPKIIRDPFKKNAVIRPSDKPGIINLTWKHKLTGVGFDKARYATIDHKNYYEGDVLHGMRITRIQSDRVHLESRSQKYFIRFRYRGALTR